MACRIKKGESVCPYVQIMQRYVEQLQRLNVSFDEELAIDMVLNSFPPSYDQSILTYQLNNTKTILTQLHNLLQIVESGMKKNHTHSIINAHILAIGSVKWKKRNDHSESNRKREGT